MQGSQGSGNSSPDRDADWASPPGEDSRPGAADTESDAEAGLAGPQQPQPQGSQGSPADEVTQPTGDAPDTPGSAWASQPQEGQSPDSQPTAEPGGKLGYGLFGRPASGSPSQPGQPTPGEPAPPASGLPDQPGYGQAGEPGQPTPGQVTPPAFGQPGPSQPGPSQPAPGQVTPGQATPPAFGQPDAGQPGSSQHSPSAFGEPSSGQPGQPPFGQAGYGQPGQPDEPRYGQASFGQASFGQASQPSYGQPPAGPPGQPADQPTVTPPPIWQAQPGPEQPGVPGQPGAQGTWVPPLPGDQASWTAPPGGQGAWGPPPPGGYGQPPGGGYGQPPVPPARPPARLGRVMVFIVVAALAAALGAGVVLALQGSPHNSASPPGQNSPTSTGQGTGGTSTATINEHFVASRVQPGLVDITSDLRYTGQVFEGTGMIISSSGLVLTNNHVVNQSTRLEVTVVSSGRRYPAQIVGTDSAEDVALLRLVGASGLRTVQVGDSSKVTLGAPVVALGNAGGAGGPPTVTSGTVTALDRTITASDSGSNSSETLHGMLQTNAPIAEGDSGGALANAAGQVIGMNTAANTQTLGGTGTDQGFAIPINRALSIAHQMEAGRGSSTIRIGQPAFIGIAIASKSATAASTAAAPQQQLQQLQRVASSTGGGINSSRHCLPGQVGNPVPASIAPASSGTLVAGVFCGAPASNAGMRGGDVIVSVDGQQVTSPASLTSLMSHYRPGTTVTVSWLDTSGKHHTSSIKLAAGPAK